MAKKYRIKKPGSVIINAKEKVLRKITQEPTKKSFLGTLEEVRKKK